MACAAPEGGKPSSSSKGHSLDVKLFITSYSDEFHAEREFIRQQVLPVVKTWFANKLNIEEYFIKWGGKMPERRDVSELERAQTSIENCYFNNIMPLFLNISSESIGWAPMWGEYPDEYVESYIDSYGLLSEDLEVLYGAYRDDNLNSLFLMRKDSVMCQVPQEHTQYFVQKTSISRKINSVGDKISQKFPPQRVVKYDCEYQGLDHKRRPELKFSDDFKLQVIDFLKQRLAYDYLGEEHMSLSHPNNFILSAHCAFMKQKSSQVYGRNDIVEEIQGYVEREQKDVPLLLLGDPGSGKTSTMCKALDVILTLAERKELGGEGGKGWRVFYHFVGAVPGSTSLEPMMKRLLREMEAVKDSTMPKDFEAAALMCCSVLSNPNTTPIIIFIDAVNQFTERNPARIVSWLPRKLAPHVRCIFSMVTDSPPHTALLKRETKPIELKMGPIQSNTKKSIVHELLVPSGVHLGDAELESLLGKESSDNPLWLTLACEEIRQNWDSDIDSIITALPEGLLTLLEKQLMRLVRQPNGELVEATLCLLECSASGLLEEELRDILGDENSLMPPSPYDEKEEKESSEKERLKGREGKSRLPDEKWQKIYSSLKPFLRPYGDSSEGRLDFYHRALSKVVRKIFGLESEGDGEKADEESTSSTYKWWHMKLADYFGNIQNLDRKIEEYPHQLVCLDDKYHLTQCLCQWDVFDKLYNEEYSSQLLMYWRKVGPSSEMIQHYETSLSQFEKSDSANEEAVSLRYEKVCRVVIQAGRHQEALELLKTAMKIEEKELGARTHRMVELYALMAEIYDEKLKLNDFVSPSQLPDLRKTINYGRKSIAIRKTLPGMYHKFKLAMSLMKLAFNMESWEACGGGSDLPGEQALQDGNKYIDRALKIFLELNDMGHYAEALMTKGVLAERGSSEQLKFYNQAMDLCMQMFGENHILTSRLYINIGIVYEDNKQYNKAYTYFKRWAAVSEEILGPDHPKTLRAKGVLREPRYKSIAQQLGEWDFEEGVRVDDDDSDESDDSDNVLGENSDLVHHYDDSFQGQAVHDLDPVMGQSWSSNAGGIGQGEGNGGGEWGELIGSMNSVHDSHLDPAEEAEALSILQSSLDQQLHDAPRDDEDRDSVSDSSSESFFEDNFEDYEENYFLHSDNVDIDEFNVHVESDDDDDNEIVQLAGSEQDDDNRFASGDDAQDDRNTLERTYELMYPEAGVVPLVEIVVSENQGQEASSTLQEEGEGNELGDQPDNDREARSCPGASPIRALQNFHSSHRWRDPGAGHDSVSPVPAASQQESIDMLFAQLHITTAGMSANEDLTPMRGGSSGHDQAPRDHPSGDLS